MTGLGKGVPGVGRKMGRRKIDAHSPPIFLRPIFLPFSSLSAPVEMTVLFFRCDCPAVSERASKKSGSEPPALAHDSRAVEKGIKIRSKSKSRMTF